jgi:hypothetical protein
MRTDNLEKVLEKLATTEKTTLVLARDTEGKIRVTSGSWDGEKVILKGQVLEVRNVDERLHVARKIRHRTTGTRRSSPVPCVVLEFSADEIVARNRLRCGKRFQTVIDYNVPVLAAT